MTVGKDVRCAAPLTGFGVGFPRFGALRGGSRRLPALPRPHNAAWALGVPREVLLGLDQALQVPSTSHHRVTPSPFVSPQHIPPCPSVSHRLPPCPSMSHAVPPCPTTSPRVPPRPLMPHGVPSCPTMSPHAPWCPIVSHHVPPCPTSSLYAVSLKRLPAIPTHSHPLGHPHFLVAARSQDNGDTCPGGGHLR